MYSGEGLVVQSVGGDNLLFMNTLNYFAYTHTHTSYPEYLQYTFKSKYSLQTVFGSHNYMYKEGTVLNKSVTELKGDS